MKDQLIDYMAVVLGVAYLKHVDDRGVAIPMILHTEQVRTRAPLFGHPAAIFAKRSASRFHSHRAQVELAAALDWRAINVFSNEVRSPIDFEKSI
jgi:hypothetical protein